MPLDRTAQTQMDTTPSPRSRLSVPRGLVAGTLVALVLVWGPYVIIGGSRISALAQTGVFAGLLVLAICNPRAKVVAVRTFQRYTINPLMRLLLRIGINPLGLAILETRGRVSGKLRRVPVGNGRKGDSFWIIAEHGTRAGYVQNIRHDPHVRVRLRLGPRYRWVPGIATICPDEDPLARQRRIIAWHPLRALNAVYVRAFGADLLAVHVKLDLSRAGDSGRSIGAATAGSGTAAQPADQTQPPALTGALGPGRRLPGPS
jgi:deazaflavin-dependent oxidoreductase (nitroreductase family)